MWPELIVGLSLSAANFGATFWLWKRSTAYYRDANTKVDAAQQAIAADKTAFAASIAARIEAFGDQAEVSMRRNAAILAAELRRI